MKGRRRRKREFLTDKDRCETFFFPRMHQTVAAERESQSVLVRRHCRPRRPYAMHYVHIQTTTLHRSSAWTCLALGMSVLSGRTLSHATCLCLFVGSCMLHASSVEWSHSRLCLQACGQEALLVRRRSGVKESLLYNYLPILWIN